MGDVNIDRLRRFLDEKPRGSVDESAIDGLLTAAWDALSGSSEGGMRAEKILGRLEDVVWDPPRLSFTIERHGAAVLGSSRAGLQEWEVDLDARVARHSETRQRRIRPTAPALDVKPLAAQTFDLIVTRERHEWLNWRADGSVSVVIGAIIPDDGPKQTIQGRRRRFREDLEERIVKAGGRRIRANVYELP